MTKGTNKQGKRWGLPVFQTYCRVFKINDFLQNRQPFTVPRTDEEIAEFLRDELDDDTIDKTRIRVYRTNFNIGKLTKGILPNFKSVETK